MNPFQIHAEGTPDESFFIPINIFGQLHTQSSVCSLCPYSAAQSEGLKCRSQCESGGIGLGFVLVRKGLWTTEMDDLFIRHSLKGAA